MELDSGKIENQIEFYRRTLRLTHYSMEADEKLWFLRLLNSPGILFLIIGSLVVLVSFFPFGGALVVAAITMTFASGYSLKNGTVVLGFISVLIISGFFGPLERVFPFLSVVAAVAVMIIVPSVVSIIRVMLVKHG